MALRRYRYYSTPRPLWRRVLDWMLTLAFFVALVLVIVKLDKFTAQSHQGVPYVIDGDTLVLNGTKIRLEGIDAPEMRQTCVALGKTYQCGAEARANLRNLIGKATLSCSGSRLDKYGRFLGVCTALTKDINREMVAGGWAVSYGSYLSDEMAAKAAKRGIWRGTFDRPQEWRQTHADIAEVPHDFWFKSLAFFNRLFGIE
jgi:endonuclease YncB( thermonuclease family)